MWPLCAGPNFASGAAAPAIFRGITTLLIGEVYWQFAGRPIMMVESKGTPMHRPSMILMALSWLSAAGLVTAQPPPQAPQPAEPQRIEARKEVIVNWTLGPPGQEQAW